MDINLEQLRHVKRLADDLSAEHNARWEQVRGAQDDLSHARRNLERIVEWEQKAPSPVTHDYSAVNGYGFRVGQRSAGNRESASTNKARAEAERAVETAEAALEQARETLTACTSRSAPARELADRCVAYAQRHGVEVAG